MRDPRFRPGSGRRHQSRIRCDPCAIRLHQRILRLRHEPHRHRRDEGARRILPSSQQHPSPSRDCLERSCVRQLAGTHPDPCIPQPAMTLLSCPHAARPRPVGHRAHRHRDSRRLVRGPRLEHCMPSGHDPSFRLNALNCCDQFAVLPMTGRTRYGVLPGRAAREVRRTRPEGAMAQHRVLRSPT
jgi:hypothetical protein